MARPLRIEFEGALYHITSRGNARAPIFLDDEDRELFLQLLQEVINRFDWLCHAYCLMDNHYHLLIETPNANLSLGMRHLNGIFTQRFNRHHGRVGHLFQGRFKAILVEKESHLLELARNIVLNPVRAGMVADAAHHPWSSYHATAGIVPPSPWLTVGWILSQFADDAAAAQKRYRRFVADGVTSPSPWSQLKGQILLGSEAFASKIQPLLEGDGTASSEISRSQRMAHRPELTSLFTDAVRTNKPLRDDAIRLVYEYGYTMTAIARHAGIHYTTVSKVVKGER
jgi:REP element-mobilizing transposase RayT